MERCVVVVERSVGFGLCGGIKKANGWHYAGQKDYLCARLLVEIHAKNYA